MPPGSGPPLIGAILDISPPDAPAAAETVPTSWRLQFAQHLDSAVFGGLFAACPASRDYVLKTSPRARLTLHAPFQPSAMDGWRKQLAAVQRALRTRGGLPTTLTVVCRDQPSYSPALALIPDAVAGSAITEVCTLLKAIQRLAGPYRAYLVPIQSAGTTARFGFVLPVVLARRQRRAQAEEGASWFEERDRDMIPPFLAHLGSALGHALTTLHVASYAIDLPPPSHFPSLRHLSVIIPEIDMCLCMSIAPYLPRITTLHLSSDDPTILIPWIYVFTEETITHTLTTLITTRPLTEARPGR